MSLGSVKTDTVRGVQREQERHFRLTNIGVRSSVLCFLFLHLPSVIDGFIDSVVIA